MCQAQPKVRLQNKSTGCVLFFLVGGTKESSSIQNNKCCKCISENWMYYGVSVTVELAYGEWP